MKGRRLSRFVHCAWRAPCRVRTSSLLVEGQVSYPLPPTEHAYRPGDSNPASVPLKRRGPVQSGATGVVGSGGLEPPACCSSDSRSNQVSYEPADDGGPTPGPSPGPIPLRTGGCTLAASSSRADDGLPESHALGRRPVSGRGQDPAWFVVHMRRAGGTITTPCRARIA